MEQTSTCVEIGEQAPDITLKDHMNNEFSLSDFKGKRVLLSFHPLAWTSVCAQQMQSLENNWNTFAEVETVPVGISIDSVPSKKAWADHLGIKQIRLLSDFWPHGYVAQQLGLFREKEGLSERANVLIDRDGLIEYIQIYELSQLPDIQEIITLVKTRFDEEY